MRTYCLTLTKIFLTYVGSNFLLDQFQSLFIFFLLIKKLYCWEVFSALEEKVVSHSQPGLERVLLTTHINEHFWFLFDEMFWFCVPR